MTCDGDFRFRQEDFNKVHTKTEKQKQRPVKKAERTTRYHMRIFIMPPRKLNIKQFPFFILEAQCTKCP